MGPLHGVRVLDLSRLLPGGFATAFLADLGAEVVKLEQPGLGDYMRWGSPKVGTGSAASWVTDRNKRSVALNLKDPRGVEAFLRLAQQADAVVESFRPGVVDRLGVGYEATHAVNRRIVYCSISGYGQDGPHALEPGHDINYIGRAGLLSITGTGDGGPAIPGVQIADIAAGGLMTIVGLLAALLRARETGDGERVDLSMTDGAFALQSVHLGDYFAAGVVPGREQMLLNGRFPCYNVYACADGRHITVGALEEQFWRGLCDGVGRPDLLPTRVDPAALEAWRAVFGARSRDEWVALLGETACVGPVNDFAEAAADPQLHYRQMVIELEHPDAGACRQVGLPIKLTRAPGEVRTPAPPLGEATRAFLRDAGYEEAAIDVLLADGVAAEPPPTS